MSRHSTRRSAWSILFVSAIALLLVAFLAACGSDTSSEATATKTTTGGAAATSPSGSASGTSTTAPAASTGSPDASVANAGAIGSCLQEKTTPAMIQDLRDGKTDTATEVYRSCLETALPSSLVAQVEPIIQQTADCGVTASKDLTDADVQKIESGDQATIQSLTQATLTCVSDQLGIPLQ